MSGHLHFNYNLNKIQKQINACCKPGGRLFVGIPAILLILVLAGLLVMMISACVAITKRPFNTAALKKKLLLLQLKFATPLLINPVQERQEIEILQNKLKSSSTPLMISSDQDLKQLFAVNCTSIGSALGNVDLPDRSSWIKLRALMFGFNEFYFNKVPVG